MLSVASVELLIVVPTLVGFAWSAYAWGSVSKVKLDGHVNDDSMKIPLLSKETKSNEEVVKKMIHISGVIADGAMSFLKAEYAYMAAFMAVFGIIVLVLVDVPSCLAFFIGGLTSIVSGWIGMRIAVYTNVRTTHATWKSLSEGFDVAVKGGCVMGLSLVSLGVLDLWILDHIFTHFFEGQFGNNKQKHYEALAGYGLGGSCIALFGRVGGGIYTKAADVGADLSGKNEYGLEEDDDRNPACIADNVGDNVGDIAGMGADLFGSFAESTCAALVLAASSPGLAGSRASLMFPVMISSVGIIVGIVTLLLQNCLYPVRDGANETVEKACKGVLIISTVLMTPVVIVLAKYSLPETAFTLNSAFQHVMWYHCAISVMLGLWSGLIIGFVTEYYTSSTYTPVREISNTQKQSAATGIIYGLALGYLSCIVPVICLGITILVAHSICGMFGVALGALGMLGTMTMALTIDAYGPISDNAGGIAEMCHLPESVREKTDCLDAAGNTTAAIGKGFAIGSAALVSLALFGAYTVRANVQKVDILNAWVFTGLLLGAMMPYAFAAWTMKSVGTAANDMVKECMEQFPKIMDKTNPMTPDYDRCIRISTDASLKEMLAPGALVIFSPLVAGLGFGKNACAGLLSGALVSSVQLAISMSNTGGAWDNSKKYISAGGLGAEYSKGSEAHKNSVTGDTVGDPLKDTSGPALNIVMKLTAIISLVFGSKINHFSNKDGGPFWM